MGRIILILLSLTVAAGTGCWDVPDDHSTISFVIGDVKNNNKTVEIGDVLKENDTIITGIRSSCDIRIGDSIIRIKEKSRVKISQLIKNGNLENITLGLDIGKMLCKPKKLMKSESFLVKTPTAVAGVRGTQFSVETDIKKTTRIKVFDGKVKVAKRVKQLENKINSVLDEAPAIKQKEKIIVTENDVKKTEKYVKKIMDRESVKGEIDVSQIIKQVKNDVIIPKKSIAKFVVEDFQKENKEIISISVKPKKIMRRIATLIKLEKEKPRPDGRLLITRYEVYFIKNGKVAWEGKVINPPIKNSGKVYIASGNYVYCASIDGTVLWRKRIENDGRIKLIDDTLHVYSGSNIIKLNMLTGEE